MPGSQVPSRLAGELEAVPARLAGGLGASTATVWVKRGDRAEATRFAPWPRCGGLPSKRLCLRRWVRAPARTSRRSKHASTVVRQTRDGTPTTREPGRNRVLAPSTDPRASPRPVRGRPADPLPTAAATAAASATQAIISPAPPDRGRRSPRDIVGNRNCMAPRPRRQIHNRR